MYYLIAILGSITAFILFVVVTVVEARAGVRVLGTYRKKLDTKVSQTAFVMQHVNWTQFFIHASQSFFERAVHDIAHWSLIFVRFMERELTTVVRYLRDRRPNMLAPKPSRSPLVAQIKGYLKKTFRGR